MLERSGLILCPWRRPLGDAEPRERRILDVDSKQPLGVARGRRGRGGLLFRWFQREILDVLETEDESLLLTLYSPWAFLNPWEIYDAEDRFVCTIGDRDLFDSSGKRRAQLQPSADGKTWRFINSDKLELSFFRSTPDGIELAFAALVRNDPFAKMAFLGATLARADRLLRDN